MKTNINTLNSVILQDRYHYVYYIVFSLNDATYSFEHELGNAWDNTTVRFLTSNGWVKLLTNNDFGRANKELYYYLNDKNDWDETDISKRLLSISKERFDIAINLIGRYKHV